MARLTWRRVLVVAVGLGILSWLVNLLVVRAGRSPMSVPWSVPIVLVMAGGLALSLGWAVREYRAGRRPGLDPFRAARTAMFAQASALAGAALVGVYGGGAVAVAADWGYSARRSLVVHALVAAASAAVLLACGWIAERWCSTSGDDDAPGAAPGKSAGRTIEPA